MKQYKNNQSYPRALNALKSVNLQYVNITIDKDESKNKCAYINIYDKNNSSLHEHYTAHTFYKEQEFVVFFELKDIERKYYYKTVEFNNLPVKDIIIKNYDDIIINNIDLSYKNICNTLDTVNKERDKEIFAKFYGLYEYEKYTLREIVKQYDDFNSAENVRQIKNRVFYIFLLDFLKSFESYASEISYLLSKKQYIELSNKDSLNLLSIGISLSMNTNTPSLK